MGCRTSSLSSHRATERSSHHRPASRGGQRGGSRAARAALALFLASSAFARNGDRGEEPTADRLESTPCLGLQSNDGCHGGHCSSAAPLSMVAGQTLLLPTLLTLWPFRTQPHRQSGLKGGRVGRWAWRRVRWIARRFGTALVVRGRGGGGTFGGESGVSSRGSSGDSAGCRLARERGASPALRRVSLEISHPMIFYV